MRTHLHPILAGAAAAVAALGAASSSPGQVLLTLDDTTIPATIQCGQTWTETNATLSLITSVGADPCPGSCFFSLAPNGPFLFGARLTADVSAYAGQITSVQVDVSGGCRAFLYESGALVDSASNGGASPTITLNALGSAPDLVTVSSCEGVVDAIRLNLQSPPTGVGEIPAGEGFAVSAAAPNPFFNETRLEFRVPAAAPVVAAVHDVRGQRVRTLLNRPLAAGTHAVTWDGRTDAGGRVPAGVYFYEVRTGRDVARRKVVRLR